MKHTASEFSRNKLFLDFLHKTFYVLIKREKQSAVFPFYKPFSSVQGTPFDGFPYGLRAAKHRAALRLSLRSRFKERSPLKIPLRGNYPFLVLCTECRTDSTGPLCAAPSRGLLRLLFFQTALYHAYCNIIKTGIAFFRKFFNLYSPLDKLMYDKFI